MAPQKSAAELSSGSELEWDDFADAASDADSDATSLDLTQALAGPSGRSKGKTRAKSRGGTNALEIDEDAGEAEDDEDLIRASLAKANLKAGASAAKSASKKQKRNPAASGITGGGSFQSLGLHPALLRALLLRGFTTPTPIQRAALPSILASPPRDVVGMARTGSGKTLAYLIPLIQRLGGKHNVRFGTRALVMVPTRELALQVLKVGKDLAKGFVQGGGTKEVAPEGEDDMRGEGLRWGLIVGGDSLDEQFSMIASNPDVLVATPGRLLHLVVEMNLDLRSVQYVVFDEADRLFELGFATQMHETLTRLPPQRQTLLFSATLPKSLVEFAKAGLQNPKLVRLDSETKISAQLQMAFFDVRPAEREAALMILLNDIIRVPKTSAALAENVDDVDGEGKKSKVKKRKRDDGSKDLAPHSTIIFTATKHHVEYLTTLLRAAEYTCSQIYSSLDQTARSIELARFRAGKTSLLVVTDLAARGIDVPVLGHVVNYDFPPTSRAFVHRVGRTARAGRTGWAYSLVTKNEMPYLMDLQLFLSRPLAISGSLLSLDEPDYTDSLVLGAVPRERLDDEVEYVRETLVGRDASLQALAAVVKRAQKMYERSQSKASAQAFKRVKELEAEAAGQGTKGIKIKIHPLFGSVVEASQSVEVKEGTAGAEGGGPSREQLLALVNGFKPSETVFEVGKKGKAKTSVAAQIMRDRRKTMEKVVKKGKEKEKEKTARVEEDEGDEEDDVDVGGDGEVDVEVAEEDELADVFDIPSRKKPKPRPNAFRDLELYLGYEQADAAAERGYSMHEQQPSSFAQQAQSAAFDLGATDDASFAPGGQIARPSQLRWDRKTKKFTRSDQQGADNKKLIRTESGAKLPASFKSGAFEEWKNRSRTRLPRIGEEELKGRKMTDARKYRHQGGALKGGDEGESAKDGKRKVFGRTPEGSKKFLGPTHQVTRGATGKGGKGKAHSSAGGARGKGGLKTAQQIRKERELKDRRTKRSNQPSRKKGRR